jgi:hypothetical protein
MLLLLLQPKWNPAIDIAASRAAKAEGSAGIEVLNTETFEVSKKLLVSQHVYADMLICYVQQIKSLLYCSMTSHI